MMTSKERSSEAQLELRALYRIGELAKLARVTRHVMVRLLVAHRVQFLRIGRAFLVPVSEIEEKLPPFWRSLRTAEQARQRESPGGRPASRVGRP
jgi:hypothetical protein